MYTNEMIQALLKHPEVVNVLSSGILLIDMFEAYPSGTTEDGGVCVSLGASFDVEEFRALTFDQEYLYFNNNDKYGLKDALGLSFDFNDSDYNTHFSCCLRLDGTIVVLPTDPDRAQILEGLDIHA